MDAIVVVAVVLTAGNCLLAVATARRLAEHGRRLASLELRGSGRPPDPYLDGVVGTRPPRFERTTTGGDRVSDVMLSGGGRSVVAFLSPQCPACVDAAGDLVAALAAGEVPQALAVVRADARTGEEIVEHLGGACHVVLDPDGSLATAFGVPVTPALLALDRDGVVAAAASSLREVVAAPVP